MITIAPFSQYEAAKEWPYYKELIDILTDREDIAILGSEEELGWKIPLCESIETIKKSRLFIGNDGGLYHIASKLGVKTIVIFMKHEHFFRCADLNKPNVKVLWRPTIDEVMQNI